MRYVDARRKLVDWLRKQLIGPAMEGRLSVSPLERYPTGVLHPTEPGVSGTDPAPAPAEQVAEEEADLLDDPEEEEAPASDEPEGRSLARPVRRRRYVPPSSAGFSFCIRGDARLLITASAACYRSVEERDEAGRFQPQGYDRSVLGAWSVTWTTRGPAAWDLWDGRAGIDVRTRPCAAGTIFTVTLFNRCELDPEVAGRRRTLDRIEGSLFEACIECAVEDGRLVEYPRVDPSLLTEEERELELQYRHRRIYAVGHGAAVDWAVEDDGSARLWCAFMPETEVPMVTVASRGDHDHALSLHRLAASIPFGAPELGALERFVGGYGDWIVEQRKDAGRLEDALERATAGRICDRMEAAHRRMRRGVALLRTCPLAERAFRLANRAMLDQMYKARSVEGGEADPDTFRWRPFQLAFLLTVMESTVREDDDCRDVLDLIWFPTGGGKTEAYLGLIAFLIVWRRLKYGRAGGGTVALMRYTLRLLTRQQFERAAGVMCALELIRREHPDDLGREPIAAGIWVGGAISPNRYDHALDAVREIEARKPGARQKLLVDRCPWCRTELDIDRGSYRATDRHFSLHCPDPQCEFGRDERPLPCNVVDEALYECPPALLVGTIDKFARLAWEARAGAFFGAGSPERGSVRPPELVIQDELHLVTGPLGSVAGLYEAGFDTLLEQRGVRAKYVASTATIRMAKEQVRRLYARDLAVFPPPGLTCDDSWFASTDRDRPGRLYVGYLAPGLDRQHCMAPLAAALLAAPGAVFGDEADREALLDAWWTLIVYHGSLRGVGASHNAFVTGVRDFGRRLSGERAEAARSGSGHAGDGSVPASAGDAMAGDATAGDATAGDATAGDATAGDATAGNDTPERFANTRIAQLTSLRTAQENTQTFQHLESGREDEGCLDAVLATNMVSVGLDVARLALMVVNGQPLTTAEYIQATSRVGRAEVPGLVFANYYRDQARSLSHYESFRPYHESFYRFVEPGSVTPCTFQVRSRALHAALVIALRHTCDGLRDNRSAGQLLDPDNPEVRAVVEALKERCASAAGPERAGETAAHVDALVAQWCDEARRCEHERRQLGYQAPDRERNAERLLRGHEEQRRGLWPTLHSMRNVESTGEFRVDADESVPVRLSHLLRHCSVGSIVRGPESLMVVPDIRRWGPPGDDPLEREIRYVDQVRSALGIERKLCRPPVATDRNGQRSGWIRTLRFPSWMRCLKCGLLHRAPWRDPRRDGSGECRGSGPESTAGRCDGRLEQVPWVLVHEDGYLADVPWHALAHAKDRSSGDCPPDGKEPYLTLKDRMAGHPVVRCGRCQSSGILESPPGQDH